MSPARPEISSDVREAPVELTVLAFIGIIGGACLTAALGALVSPGAMDPWYQSLNRAPGDPPGYRSYALDPERAAALWSLSEQLVGERFPLS